jgi:HEAT repeat protein
MVLLLISSFILAVAVGDIVFPGDWRKDSILKADQTHDNDELVLEDLNDHRTEFFLLIIGCIVINAIALNWSTDSFLSEYNDYGFFVVRLRAEAPSERLAALNSLSEPINRDAAQHVPVQKSLVDRLDDDDPEVRHKAIWLAGELDLARAEAKLRELATDSATSEQTRHAAFVALGKLSKGRKKRASLLTEQLEKSESTQLQKGILRGLGILGSAEPVDAMVPFIDNPDIDIKLNALWALRQIGSTRARDRVRRLAEESSDKTVSCAAYDTLKFVATNEDVLWARKRFQELKPKTGCDRQTWMDGSETHVLIYGDSFREKCLKIVANTNPSAHKQWFQLLANDKSEPFRIRKVASKVLGQLRKEEE